MLVENNLAALWRQLGKAEQKLAEANKELRSAERKADRASAVVSNLHEEIALEKLRMWGDKPDLAELMASGKNSTMVFYRAMEQTLLDVLRVLAILSMAAAGVIALFLVNSWYKAEQVDGFKIWAKGSLKTAIKNAAISEARHRS